jgi:hypothetical protein
MMSDGGCTADAAPAPAGAAGPANCPQIRGDAGDAGDAGEGQHALEAAPIRRVIPAQRRLEPLSADRFAVRFTADAEFRELLEEVRGLFDPPPSLERTGHMGEIDDRSAIDDVVATSPRTKLGDGQCTPAFPIRPRFA